MTSVSFGSRPIGAGEAAMVAGLGFAHGVVRCDRCGALGHVEAACPTAAESDSLHGAPSAGGRDAARRGGRRDSQNSAVACLVLHECSEFCEYDGHGGRRS